MFTGIIEELGVIQEIKKGSRSSKLLIKANKVLESTKVGDSICTNGVCLTVTDLKINSFEADVMAETLRRSNLGDLKVGSKVNLERALMLQSRLGGALDGLKRHGVEENNIDVAWVPGAFEIPLVAKKMAKNDKYDVVVCLGAVIKGSTPHFDYVCAEASKGIASVSLQTEKPVIFGVLTTDTIEHAIERADTKAGNKGYDAAVTAIEMANLLKNF